MSTKSVQNTTIQVSLQQQEPIVIHSSGKYIVEIIEAGAHAEIVGTFFAKEEQQVNVEVLIVHRVAHTTAKTTLKGVARDRGSIRFLGRIIIQPGCSDTNSFLEERILLLSDTARAEAVPELEILSDDVKCSHAATISNIPKEHLFYLQSRGISKAAAEQLIVDGFLSTTP